MAKDTTKGAAVRKTTKTKGASATAVKTDSATEALFGKEVAVEVAKVEAKQKAKAKKEAPAPAPVEPPAPAAPATPAPVILLEGATIPAFPMPNMADPAAIEDALESLYSRTEDILELYEKTMYAIAKIEVIANGEQFTVEK